MEEQNERPEQTPEENQQLLLGYGIVFQQLLQSDKFKLFVETYFTIQKMINEEEKTIELRVLENPPEEVMKRMQTAVEATKPESKIEVVSGARAAQVIDMAKKKAKSHRRS